MKLLFDQNLAHGLVTQLLDLFPGSRHVKDLGLTTAPDDVIWVHAAEYGFAIVSKDSDFQQRSLLFGPPPKVIWLRVGNCPTLRIEGLLRSRSAELHTFATDDGQSLLILF